ncbi:D-alanine--D-alanine ligase [Blattabacterium cuenoti]|uniref:D-alanine--D-alanine ligase n=1 Tax=Blattabacterium cuenoti TaxID=1653831 RepID=UPI00163C8FEA|nr:D-alanine--D-alanine ligase [Blattabacterium cuenoti]
MKKIAVAIVMGGYTKESLISIKSGTAVYNNLNKSEFDIYMVYIFNDRWVLKNNENKEYHINKHDFSVKIGKKNIKFDCVFNVIHGTPGEDGMLQAYFQLLGIPCTGCNFHHSNITFNKKYCLTLLKNFGINTAKFIFLNKNQIFNEKKILKKIGLPCFVKPSRSGSSLGISKVYEEKNFFTAVKKAFEEDKEIIIESFLDGKEISVGVFSYDKEIFVLPITEIISQNDFFDFESKYSGKSNEITPAELHPKIGSRIYNVAKKVYEIFNLSGMSRSEYIIVNGEPYFLEINTIPGLSKESIFPKQLESAGIPLSFFLKKMIEVSITRK